jgi:hypothetical protein
MVRVWGMGVEGMRNIKKLLIFSNFTYCHVRLLLIPSRNLSRSERWRLGVEPVNMCWWSLDEELKNFVGLRCCWDSIEWDGDEDLKLGLNLLSGERCFGENSSRDADIFVILLSCPSIYLCKCDKLTESLSELSLFFAITVQLLLALLTSIHSNWQKSNWVIDDHGGGHR